MLFSSRHSHTQRSLARCASLLVYSSITGIKTQSVFSSVHFVVVVLVVIFVTVTLVAVLFSLLCVCCLQQNHINFAVFAQLLRPSVLRLTTPLHPPRDPRLTFSLNVFQYFWHPLYPSSLPLILCSHCQFFPLDQFILRTSHSIRRPCALSPLCSISITSLLSPLFSLPTLSVPLPLFLPTFFPIHESDFVFLRTKFQLI